LSSSTTQSETYSSSPRPGELPFAALAGDDRRQAAILDPAEQASQLRAQQRWVGETRKQGLDRVEHDALGADAVHREAEADE
jgi:hypothetical protein